MITNTARTKVILFFVTIGVLVSCNNQQETTTASNKKITISKSVLQDKIKGGWAGQTIGVTYGGPMEFRFQGTMIQDYQKIAWPAHTSNGITNITEACMMIFIWISLL